MVLAQRRFSSDVDKGSAINFSASLIIIQRIPTASSTECSPAPEAFNRSILLRPNSETDLKQQTRKNQDLTYFGKKNHVRITVSEKRSQITVSKNKATNKPQITRK